MSDDVFRGNEEDGIEAMETHASVNRRSTTTDGLNTMFDVFADSHRRHLLYHLATLDEAVVELEAAVDAVLEYEAARTETVDQSVREDVKIGLHHNHLPRLAKTRILDYDHRHGTIRLTGDDEIEEWIEFARSKEAK